MKGLQNTLKNILKRLTSLERPQVYLCLLTQTGTDAPTVVVLNSKDTNFLGDIVWTRNAAGVYHGTRTGAFKVNTFSILIGNQAITGLNDPVFGAARVSDDVIAISSGTGAALADAKLTATPVQIIVYPVY